MKIYSNNIKNGYLDPAFGKHGSQFLQGKKPSRSFHLAWDELPKGTKSLAIIFDDEDAIEVCGFNWIHWTVANIDPNLKQLPENASEELDLLQGVTSWSSPIIPKEWQIDKTQDANFGGCAPPDKEHRYGITLYALDKTLNLVKGFYKNELVWAMQGHILASQTLYFKYKS